MLVPLALTALLSGLLSGGVSITIENGVTELSGRVEYAVQVINREPRPVQADVRIAFPPGLTNLRAEGATLSADHAGWEALLPTGTSTFRLSGRADGGRPSDAVAATACVYLDNPTRPEVCASDIDMIGVRGDWSLLGVVALLMALIGAGGAAYLLMRTRRTVTELAAPSDREPERV
ncbi:hypothetical protein [Herbidospora cretacea]|uniref:hypothetical protein n=1 Tax=Herbidospora cretacea TaxID=28444 RepID=UPI0012DE309B|nr:hypothetical protein [Herbidospora cretacea]